MNEDLQQLLDLRANMSYLFSFTEAKKKEIASLEKERDRKNEKLTIVKKQETEKYKNSRKLIPSAQKHKDDAEKLKRQLNKMKDPPAISDGIDIFFNEIVIKILLGVGAVGGAVLFCFVCNKWLHMNNWVNPDKWVFELFFIEFKVRFLGWAFKYILYGIIFILFAAIGAVAIGLTYAALVMIGILTVQLWFVPLKIKRKKISKEIKQHENYVYHSSRNVYLDVVPSQKQEAARMQAIKEECKGRVLEAQLEVEDVEKRIGECALQISKAHYAFHHTKFIILEKDYKYLDYLIYLIISHRADTLTEAFRELEMQIRHNELMNKLSSLESNITRSISSLSSEIEGNTKAIQHLETTFVAESSNTHELIREGNRISSQNYDQLESVNNYLSNLDKKIPLPPWRI